MTRFSLEPIYRDIEEDYDEDDSVLSPTSCSNSSSQHDDEYYIDDSDSDDDQEEPHPLGFGRTRFGLYSSSRQDRRMSPTITITNTNSSTFDDIDNASCLDDYVFQKTPIVRRKPLLQNAQDTKLILNHYYESKRQMEDRKEKNTVASLMEDMDRIAAIVGAASMMRSEPNLPLHRTSADKNDKLNVLLHAAEEQRRIEEEARISAQKFKEEVLRRQHDEAMLLLNLIKKEEAEADAILAMEKACREKIEREERELEEEQERQRIEQVEKEEKARILKEKEDESIRVQKKKEEHEKEIEVAKKEQELQERAEKRAEKYKYVTDAKTMVEKLVHVRASIEVFETSKDKLVSKRRLQMKKIAKGKMNTLTHEKEKVDIVTQHVSEAINACVQEDSKLRTEMENGNTAVTMDMTRGARYLMDLVASSVLVRVQAEGFNGTRGDGFPLAHMLAQTSTIVPSDFSTLLVSHIYSVCPTAIPTLPTPAHGCSETELMESLGMMKNKDGEFETFDRFLARTEGLISIVAEIMCSLPVDHNLFGGPNTALIWLERFLDLLPPDQSPLPLLTAPVLVSFLTAAGHMLSNRFPDEFKQMFDLIKNDISKRLDVTPIGQPSATRLSKILSGGLEEMRAQLPHGAVKEFYYISENNSMIQNHSIGQASQSSAQPVMTSQPFGSTMQNTFTTDATKQQQSFQSSGFSSTTTMDNQQFSQGANPFGAGKDGEGNFHSSSQSTNPSPFGVGGFNISNPSAAGSASNPFGGSSNTASNPFGTSASSNPFGGGFNSNERTSNTTSAPVSNPFGNSNLSQGFATNPFGSNSITQSNTTASARNPFNSANNPTQDMNNSQDNRTPCPFFSKGYCKFGDKCKYSHVLPGKAASNSGATNTFGSNQNNTSFQNKGKQICKFFAQGKCRYGDKCKNSHELPGNSNSGGQQNSANGPFGTAPAPSPFGGGGFNSAPAPSPFGGGGFNSAPAPSPFGGGGFNSAPAPSPFGGGGFNAAPAPSPFGGGGFNTAPAPSPFGGGGFNAAPAPSPFGGGGFNTAPASSPFASSSRW